MSGAVTVGVAATAIIGATATVATTTSMAVAAFAVIGAVGATTAAIGKIAKVKELQIAGTALGVVGAVGGIASAANVFGMGSMFGEIGGAAGGVAGAAGAGAVSTAASDAATIAAGTVEAGGGLFSGPAAIDTAARAAGIQGSMAGLEGSQGFIDIINGAASAPTAATATADPGVIGGEKGPGLTSATTGKPADVAGLEAPQGTVQTTTPGTPTTTTPSTPAINQGATAPEGNLSGFGPGQGPAGASGGARPGTSVFKDVWDFFKENKTITGGLIQAGGSFLSGALNPLTGSQQAALDAQAKANKAAAAKYDAEASILGQQRQNMAGALPVAQRVTGRPMGLIDSPVTGVAA